MDCREKPLAGGSGDWIRNNGSRRLRRRRAFCLLNSAKRPWRVQYPEAVDPVDQRIEIALPGGVAVRVGRGFDAEALHRVLTVLGR